MEDGLGGKPSRASFGNWELNSIRDWVAASTRLFHDDPVGSAEGDSPSRPSGAVRPTSPTVRTGFVLERFGDLGELAFSEDPTYRGRGTSRASATG